MRVEHPLDSTAARVHAKEAGGARAERRRVGEPSEVRGEHADFRHVRDHDEDVVVLGLSDRTEGLRRRALVARKRAMDLDRSIEAGLSQSQDLRGLDGPHQWAGVDPGVGKIDHISAMGLVQATRKGYGKSTPEEQRRTDVTILDVYGNTASVKMMMHDWVDYMHMVKSEGRWKIVNVLWEMSPEAKKKYGIPEDL